MANIVDRTIFEQLPLEIQHEISSFLCLNDAANYCASSKHVSPTVLSCCQSPTVKDLLLIKSNTNMLKLVLEYAKITVETLQTFFNQVFSWKFRLEQNKDVISILIKDSRIDPSVDDNYAIRWASGGGYTEIVDLLLKDPRVDPSAEDNDAIRWAYLSGHKNIVEMLFSKVNSSEDNGGTSTDENLQLILKGSKVSPDFRNDQAIRWARINGPSEMGKLLFKDPPRRW
jgi:ankyrin repeat protein